MDGTDTEIEQEESTEPESVDTPAVNEVAADESSPAPSVDVADSLTSTGETESVADTEGADNSSESDGVGLFADVSLPEGVELDVTALETFEPLLKDFNMSTEQAQSFANAYLSMQESRYETANQLIEEDRKTHIEDLKNDPDFGGAQFNTNMKHVAIAIGNNEGQELAQVMMDYGLDNHPVFIKYLASMGRNLREDAMIGGGSRAASTVRGIDALFPSTAGEL